MGEMVSFKASKCNLEGEAEVRRFQVDKDVSTSFPYLQQKLASVFPDISRKVFSITWVDTDNDIVTIATDEDLIIALTEMEGPLYRINVSVKGDMARESNNEGVNNKGEVHAGVTCDGCQRPVHGFRYKCMSCPDFDLCSGCESNGVHGEHNMLRMVKPLPSAWPQHLFKKFQRLQERADKRKCGNQNMEEVREVFIPPPFPHHPPHGQPNHPPCGPPHYPPHGPPPHGPRPGGRFDCLRGGRGVGPMRGRGCGTLRGRRGMGPVFTSPNPSPFERLMNVWGRNGSFETADESNTEKKEAEEIARKQTVEVLNNLGQYVAAALDPFGIDVGVSVVTKNADKQDNTASENEAPVPTNVTSAENNKAKGNVDAEKERPMDTDESQEDSEWTVIKDGEQAKEGQGQLYPNIQAEVQIIDPQPGTSGAATEPEATAPLDQEMLDPKIQVALEAMMNMGFNNEGGWLSSLLKAKDGDISKVLDILQPVRK